MNKYAIICSGQGSLSPDIFQLAKTSSKSISVINQFSDSFSWDMFLVERGCLDLSQNHISQPLTIATSMANWEALKDELPSPFLIAGYSAGEVAAWGCSGAISTDIAALLSWLRCESMEKFAPPGAGMLAVKGVSVDSLLDQLADHDAYIAIINEADHFIIGGLEKGLNQLEVNFQSSGIWCKRLLVSVPSHTPLLRDVAAYFGNQISEIKLHKLQPKISVIQGVNGLIASDLGVGIDSLIKAISTPINWQSCMQTLVDSGVRVVLELGPGGSLSKMISEIHPSISARSVSDFRTVQGIKQWLLRQLED